MFKQKNNSKKGSILILVLTSTAIFIVMSLSLASLTVSQHKMTNYKENWNQAFHIAEAGIDYYKWHLAHDPRDFENTSSCISRDQETTLFSRLGSESEITSPEVGPSGSLRNNNGTISFPDALDGKGAEITINHYNDGIAFPTANVLSVDNGSIIIWYKPYYDHTESVFSTLFEDDGTGEFELTHDTDGSLSFKVEGNVNIIATAQPSSYSWNANDWVKIEAKWESVFPGAYDPTNQKYIKLLINDTEVACASEDNTSSCYDSSVSQLGDGLTLGTNIVLSGRGSVNGILDTIVISKMTEIGEGTTPESIGTYFGPYIFDYKDTTGQIVGQYVLEIERPDRCSNSIAIKSTGYTTKRPETKRTIEVKFGKKTLAEYALASNTTIHIASDKTVLGPIHSNIGVRQDGTNNSLVTASQSTYRCTLKDDCFFWGETKPGIWGAGEDSNLWSFPAQNIDFNLLTTNLSDLKATSQRNNLYFPETSSGLGYHVVFKDDSTFDIYQINKLKNSISHFHRWRWLNKKFNIKKETLINNYEIPSNCAIIFIEDNVWVDGTIDGRTTVVAAKLPDIPATRKNIYINDNIVYEAKDGTNVLGLIAQNDIIVTYETPENLEINAAMIAQKGGIYRPNFLTFFNLFFRNSDYIMRDKITIYGSIVSNQDWYWFNSISGFEYSGYRNETNIYDPQLTYYPPPGFPTYGEYSILQWEEVTEK
jgi:hypothetical protein